MRSTFVPLLLSALLLGCLPLPAAAQGVGLGARFTFVRADVESDASAERFSGVHLRASVSRRTAIEVSLDRRVQTNGALTERTRDYPLQTSLLLFPIRSTFSPYALGGIGWYMHRVDLMAADEVVETVSTRRFGSHAGFGAEMKLGRHAGLHADYRYTFLSFRSKDTTEAPETAGGAVSHGLLGFSPSRLLPDYEGSMWTAGLTVYF